MLLHKNTICVSQTQALINVIDLHCSIYTLRMQEHIKELWLHKPLLSSHVLYATKHLNWSLEAFPTPERWSPINSFWSDMRESFFFSKCRSMDKQKAV